MDTRTFMGYELVLCMVAAVFAMGSFAILTPWTKSTTSRAVMMLLANIFTILLVAVIRIYTDFEFIGAVYLILYFLLFVSLMGLGFDFIRVQTYDVRMQRRADRKERKRHGTSTETD